MAVMVNKKDEMIMRLVHYFVTEEDYSPIVVNGVKDEIWLQNQNGPYKIVRINSNYIHNKEQFEYDVMKLKNVMGQVKKKTLSWSMNALNILLDVNDGVSLENQKNISSVSLKDVDVIENQEILNFYPNINEKLMKDEAGLDLMINVTNDINKKTEKENRVYESIFKQKKIVVTNVLIAINVIVFFASFILTQGNFTVGNMLNLGAINYYYLRNGEIWRLITAGFLHGGIMHLLFNMYSLYIIGTQIENFIGKKKYLIIYFFSMICAGLMSCALSTNTVSVGASGAIFGLLGSLVYFGFYYRLYLGSVLKNQIIPLIALNLILGFMTTGIDNAAHIGGLIAGLFIAMGLGVQRKENHSNKMNGIIVSLLYSVFLIYLVFFR
ncbi:MAG: rhomboid family intramembrane serine protease [Bacilli bacterium]|nr:rhomboid family intramembrane serine protease [Bacilli bacterium]